MFTFLFYLIKVNPVKFCVSVIFILLLYPINNLNSTYEVTKEFLVHTQLSNKDLFIISDNDQFVLLELKTFNINDNKVSYRKDEELLIVSWIVFVMCGIFLVIGTFNRDTDANWNLREVRTNTLRKKIKCIIEYEKGEEIFSYTLNDRLLFKENKQVRYFNDLIDRYLDSPKSYPKYTPLEQRRENKLNEILK
jgi:hypothetical protein